MPTGCGSPAMIGLRPENPPVTRKGFSLRTEFVAVDTLTPTFRWRPLSLEADRPTDKALARIDNLSYEIRIWRTTSIGGGKLVHLRDGLAAPQYRLEQPLDPGTRYYWSVRAHFEIDGRDRTTEWALAGYLLRNEAVPNVSCLRFRTPEKLRTTPPGKNK